MRVKREVGHVRPPTLFVEEGDEIDDLADELDGDTWYHRIVLEELDIELVASQEHNIAADKL
jgi:hypothetical protein